MLAVMVAVMVAVYCRPKLSLHIHAPHATNTLPDPIDSADFGDTRMNKQVSYGPNNNSPKGKG